MLDFPHRTVSLPQGNLSTVVILSLPSLLFFISPMGNAVGESLDFFVFVGGFLQEVIFFGILCIHLLLGRGGEGNSVDQ